MKERGEAEDKRGEERTAGGRGGDEKRRERRGGGGRRQEGKVVFSVNGIRLRCDSELSHCEKCELSWKSVLLQFDCTPRVN